mgnify:FL=1|tara:strand:- start:44 stop:244 length:201 start_codon:yes stop_codon:yes gene_type:complete
MAKKFIKCFCSKVGKPTKSSNYYKDERSIYSDKCECTVNGSHLTKHGRDDIVVEVIKSKRKGYEAF